MPSDLDGLREAIETRIEDGWDTDETPIQWLGAEFKRPSTGTWIRITILWGDGFPETIGAGGLNQLVGVLSCSVFGTPGSGMGDLYHVADQFRDKLNRVEVDGVRFEVPSGLKLGDPEPEWLHGIIDVPFYALESV